NLLAAAIAAIVLVAAALVVVRPAHEPEGRPEAAEELVEEGHELLEPSEALLARELFGADTKVPSDVFPQAQAQSRALARATRASDPAVARQRWQLVGPTNIGGRVLDVAVDPGAADTIFIASAGGGVWKSTDAGTTFGSAWPADETQSIGALTMSPSGVLYAGTGETGPGGGSLTYGGTGLYRSDDRGASWRRIGLPDSSRISRIVLDPSDERRIYVAASGPLYKPGGQRGLYRSDDGGQTWDRVLRGDNETTGATDVAIDPRDHKVVYATTWDALREPDRRSYTGTGSGLYKSTDGGETWTRLGNGLFGPNPQLGRLGVAVAADGTLYVISSGPSGAHSGFFRSTDGGQTFLPSTAPDLATAAYVYGWWFGRVWADPRDPQHVYVAGVNLAESTDGGATWGSPEGFHADQHAMAWDPKRAGRVYLGNDGGVYRSDNNGRSWTFAKSMPFSQPYSVDVSEQDPSRITTGLQDNGSNRSWGGKPGQWTSYYGGDGQRTLINPRNQQIVYGCYQYGECAVSTNGGDDMTSFTESVISTRKNWFTPIEFDPEDPHTIYTGGEIMSRSDDDAQSFTPISADLSNGPGRETNPLFKNFGTLTTIAPAGKSTGAIYAGTDDGNLWSTHDGGATWTQATDPDLPKAWITRVEVAAGRPDVAYVTYSGFRQADDAAYILRTTDGGRHWSDITGDLPKAPLNDVNVIGDAVVVAGDLGVFATGDGGRHWLKVGRDLPLAPVFELRYHAPTDTLYAATFGRSIWRLPLAAVEEAASAYADAAPAGAAAPAPLPAARRRARSRRAPTLGLPSNRRCVRRGRLAFRLSRSLRSVRVTVNGRRVDARPGRLVRIRVARRGTIVRVTARTRGGSKVTVRRRYRACG
ncbi:MAG TPA: hypothetical protein VGJ70_26425, partial [Solirubrobacteraceae bacterium]